MLETGRRTVINTSQLGLYSDNGDRYRRNRYNSITRKFVIGVMVVVIVMLIGIFLYDFASASSVNNKLNQESKHMYILQNALKKPSNLTKKLQYNTTVSPEVNRTSPVYIQDRSDNDSYENLFPYDGAADQNVVADPEFKSQNLNNFKLRKRVLKSVDEAAEGKQLFDNHAIVYRVKQRHKYPTSSEDESSEESRPTPFHWELKTPQPTAFKRQRYPQLSQYRYPYASRNIQDIIKYLTNDADLPNRGIKFAGVYVNPKKYDLFPPGIGEMMSNSDRSEEDETSSYPLNEDPFYQYKPRHPTDVNLLATSNVRFSPTGLHKYNYEYGRPINYYKPTSMDSLYESPISYSNNYSKKRKPQPFSVMLDIYPITDIAENQNKKGNRPRQVPIEDYEVRRPIQYNRGPKFYSPPPQTLSDEEEKQQMVFHLNLYPRKKNKMSRYDIIHRSESMPPEERQQFVDKVWSPLETIAKHLAVEQSKFVDDKDTNFAATRYQETVLDDKDEVTKFRQINDSAESSDNPGEASTIRSKLPSNHRSNIEEDYASTEKYEVDAKKIVATTIENECDDCSSTTAVISKEISNINETESIDQLKSIDTIEGFTKFNDSIS